MQGGEWNLTDKQARFWGRTLTAEVVLYMDKRAHPAHGAPGVRLANALKLTRVR